ncbi:MAG: hypothetical protein WCG34_10875, partial [Leptolinea sp.]
IIPKPEWRLRKETYISHIKSASPSVRLVSSCDKVHNARTILADYREKGDAVWERFKGRKDGSLWYYRSLVKEYKSSDESHPVFNELERIVREIYRLAGIDYDQP